MTLKPNFHFPLRRSALALTLLLAAPSWAQEKTTVPSPSPAPKTAALLLDPASFTLPKGTVGKSYVRNLKGQGGQTPYTYQLTSGTLPEGLTLSSGGSLSGTPAKKGIWTFTAAVTDAQTQTARQTYTMRVDTPKGAKPWQPQALVYNLTADVLDELAPPEAEAPTDGKAADNEASDSTEEPQEPKVPFPAALDALTPEEVKQISAQLQPILDVEYPERTMFLAALDQHLSAPKADALRKTLRTWLEAWAKQTYFFAEAGPFRCQDAGHGYKRDDLSAEIYGFFPFWSPKEPRRIDLSLLTRVSSFAIPMLDSGQVELPKDWNSSKQYFAQTLRTYGVKHDLTIFREDWAFLQGKTAGDLEGIIRICVSQTADLVDKPLTNLASKAKAYLPGFAVHPRLADGVTLYFRPPSDPTLMDAFRGFRTRMIRSLIDTLRARSRTYTLNVVIPELMTSDKADQDIKQLFELFCRAENVGQLVNDRITGSSSDFVTRSNLTMRILVMLPEPTNLSKKQLRILLENSPVLHGSNRRIFTHQVIPILTGYDSNRQQFQDDMVYCADAFGGVGLWTAVYASDEPKPGDWADWVHQALISAFAYDTEAPEDPIQDWIRIHRWPIRTAFELLLALVLGAAIYTFLIGCPHQVKKTRLFLLLGGTALDLALGGLLLTFDPALQAMREGNALLWIIILALAVSALLALFKPRVLKP